MGAPPFGQDEATAVPGAEGTDWRGDMPQTAEESVRTSCNFYKP